MKLSTQDKFVFIGDSITDAGRARPVGVGPGSALGDGYVRLVDSLLGVSFPELGVHVSNVGISGNTVRDLAGRWQTDVFDLAPDWLSVMIGTNDVWRQFDRADDPSSHVYPDEYIPTLDRLLAQTRPTVKGLVLMTPFLVEPNVSDPMRVRMDEYCGFVRAAAQKHDCLLVDTQVVYNALMAHLPPAVLAPDRVHPSLTGHMALARAVLTVLEA